MFALLQLLADAADSAPKTPATPASPGGLLTPDFILFVILPVMVFFYFFMVRLPRKQENERQKLLNALKKNDKVETSGGLIGIVANVKDKEDEVTLKVDENSNVRLRVTRRSIVRIFSGDEANKEQKEGGAEK